MGAYSLTNCAYCLLDFRCNSHKSTPLPSFAFLYCKWQKAEREALSSRLGNHTSQVEQANLKTYRIIKTAQPRYLSLVLYLLGADTRNNIKLFYHPGIQGEVVCLALEVPPAVIL